MLHYRNLKLHLSLGTKLTKIHRVLKFKQSDWMKKYINLNTEKRMIHCVYGKTMESLRKRMNIRLVNKEEDFLKYTSRPTHIHHKIFGKNYAAIHESNQISTLNKPIYVEFTIVELSNWLMYNFHYSFTKNTLMLNFYLLTLTRTALLMKKNRKMFTKNYTAKRVNNATEFNEFKAET